MSFRGSRPMLFPSKNYKEWHTQAIRQLAKVKPIVGPLYDITLKFFPQTHRKSDSTNKAESIMDLLVDAGIIEDDNWFICPKMRLEFGGVDKDNPRVEIELEWIWIT